MVIDGEERDAGISEDQVYRRWLSRIWNKALPLVLFVGLNPSTADGKDDDHTIRKERAFTKLWLSLVSHAFPHPYGFGGFLKGNLYDFRTKSPKLLLQTAIERGAYVSSLDNDISLRILANDPRVELIVPAWGGVHERLKWRIPDVTGILKASGKPLCCLGYTSKGEPRHPLMLSYKTALEPWVRK